MRPVFVVVVEELGDAVTTGVPAGGGVQIDVIIFERAPQALDEHVVDGPADAAHGDCDAGLLQGTDESL